MYTRAVASAAIDPGLGQVGRAVCRVGLDRAAAAAAAMDPGAMAATATAVTGRASWMLRSVLDFLVDTQGGTKNVPQPTQLDFADPGAAAAFRAVDDSVMGGSSVGYCYSFMLRLQFCCCILFAATKPPFGGASHARRLRVFTDVQGHVEQTAVWAPTVAMRPPLLMAAPWGSFRSTELLLHKAVVSPLVRRWRPAGDYVHHRSSRNPRLPVSAGFTLTENNHAILRNKA